MLGNPGHITIQRGPGEGPFTIDLTPPPPPPPPPAEDAGQRRRREEDEAFRTNMAQWQSTVIYNWYEAQSAALTASQRLGADIAAVEGYNQAVRFYNGRVLGVLQAVTQQQFGHDREAWARWWADSRGYAYDGARPGPKPTIDVAVQDFVPQFASPTYIYVHNSCFAAGTPVRTLNGRLPIEALKVGDRLLVEDPATGALSFQPIVAVFHNPPAPTLRVELEDESIVVTGIHRFWVAGRGWRMARELKPGDAVRLVGGIARVAAVKPDATQKVYNLEVASGRSFFVGRRGALVHDNTTVEPTPRPFDAQAATLAD
jgi:hypothetical protein